MILTRSRNQQQLPRRYRIQFKDGDQYRKHTYRELITTWPRSPARSPPRHEKARPRRGPVREPAEWVFSYLAITSLGAVVAAPGRAAHGQGGQPPAVQLRCQSRVRVRGNAAEASAGQGCHGHLL